MTNTDTDTLVLNIIHKKQYTIGNFNTILIAGF